MKRILKLLLFILIFGGLIAAIFFFFQHTGAPTLLNPKGTISLEERDLMRVAVFSMLVLAIPVYILLFFFAWKYRADKKGKHYSPNLKSNTLTTILMWAIPTALIAILAVINWRSTHALDPYKPIVSDQKPITIQVVALQWKWLFIYPEENIATVNFIEFPENVPVNFELTADAPMNSFWIPQLGGQMYAMAGMKTQLHLMASGAGEFRGSSAEISGAGFAGMKFAAKAVSKDDFNQWVAGAKYGPYALTADEYTSLAEPSRDNPPTYYASVEKDLFNSIMMKFMVPASPSSISSSTEMPSMDMK